MIIHYTDCKHAIRNNKLNFSLLIRIYFIPDGADKNYQSISLLGIRSRLPPASYVFLLVTFLKCGKLFYIKTKRSWNRTQTSLKCNLFNALLEYWYTHFRRLDFLFATVEQNATEHCFIIIGKSCFSSDAIIFGQIAISHRGLAKYLKRVDLRQIISDNSSKTTVCKS